MRVAATGQTTLDRMPALAPSIAMHVGQPDEAHLRGAVVGLAEVAEDAGVGRGEDEPAVAVLLHDLERRLRDVERALEVDVEHGVEVVPGQLRERLVAQDAGVVDDDVDLAERVDRGLDDALAALGGGHRVVVRHGVAAGGLDLVDDLLRGCVVAALAVDRAAEVVDDDLRAAARHLEGVGPAQPAAGAGHDRDPAIEGDLRHAALRFHRRVEFRPG